ncbi:putative lipoprotein [Streptococcus sp. DD11]|nr:putative lipoprotein [Streptococcus sp. DD11]
MKKGRMFMLAATAALVVGGTIMTVQNKSLFTDGIFDLRSPREKQLTYLKNMKKTWQIL